VARGAERIRPLEEATQFTARRDRDEVQRLAAAVGVEVVEAIRAWAVVLEQVPVVAVVACRCMVRDATRHGGCRGLSDATVFEERLSRIKHIVHDDIRSGRREALDGLDQTETRASVAGEQESRSRRKVVNDLKHRGPLIVAAEELTA